MVVGASDDDGTEADVVSIDEGSLVDECVPPVEPVELVVPPLPEQPTSTATPTSIETARSATLARLIAPQ